MNPDDMGDEVPKAGNNLWKGQIAEYYRAYRPKKMAKLKATGKWDQFLVAESLRAADLMVDKLLGSQGEEYSELMDQVSREIMPRDPSMKEPIEENYDTF